MRDPTRRAGSAGSRSPVPGSVASPAAAARPCSRRRPRGLVSTWSRAHSRRRSPPRIWAGGDGERVRVGQQRDQRAEAGGGPVEVVVVDGVDEPLDETGERVQPVDVEAGASSPFPGAPRGSSAEGPGMVRRRRIPRNIASGVGGRRRCFRGRAALPRAASPGLQVHPGPPRSTGVIHGLPDDLGLNAARLEQSARRGRGALGRRRRGGLSRRCGSAVIAHRPGSRCRRSRRALAR